MKRLYFSVSAQLCALALCLFTTTSLFAQTPQGINYQAVARDTSGAPLENEVLDVTITIAQDINLGTIDYVETHSVQTNRFGLFTLVIGSETPDQGVFADIDWSTGSKFLNVRIGSDDLGTTRLMAVPFALYAESAGGSADDGDWDTTDAVVFTNKAVGIGTQFPNGQIGVRDDTTAAYVDLRGGGDGGNYSGITFGNTNNNISQQLSQRQVGSEEHSLVVEYNDGSNITATMIFTPENRVGIGTLSPTSTLEVEGSFKSDTISVGDEFTLPATAGNQDEVLTMGTGGNVIWAAVSGNDNDSTNELLVAVTLNGTDLEIEDAGGQYQIDLSSLVDSVESVALNGSVLEITSSVGNVVTTDLAALIEDDDADSTNELITTLALVGNELQITEGGVQNNVDLTNLKDSVTSLDLQGTTLIIESTGGDTVEQSLNIFATDVELATEVSDLNDRIDSNAAEILLTNGDITTLQTDVSTLDTRVDSVANEILLTNVQVTGLQTDVTNLDSRIDSNAAEILLRDAQIQENQDSIALLDGRIDSNAAEMLLRDAQIQQNQDSIALVDGRIDSNAAEILLRDAQIQQNQDSIALVDGRVDSNAAEILLRDAQIQQNQDSLEIVDARIDSAAAELLLHIQQDNDTSATNELVDSLVFDSISSILYLYQAGALIDSASLMSLGGSGDDLGDHTLDTNLILNGRYISNDGDDEGISMDADGDVGIGTTPSYLGKFNVNSTGFLNSNLEGSSTAGTWMSLGNTSAGGRYYQFISTGASNGEGPGKLLIGYGSIPNSVSGASIVIDSSNVGIGTANPGSKLDVAGRLKADTIEVDGAYTLPPTAPSTTGDVLTYNGTNLVWQAPGATTIPPLDSVLSSGSDAGNDTIYNLSRMGIGTSTPNYELDVNGSSFVSDTSYVGFGAPFTGEGVLSVFSSTEGKNVAIHAYADNGAVDTSFAIVSQPVSYGSAEFSFWGRNGVLYNRDEVGIGTSNPDSMLTVSGGIMADAIRLTDGATAGYVLTSAADGSATWQAVPASSFTDTLVSGALTGNNLVLTDNTGDVIQVDLSTLKDTIESINLIGTELIITSADGDTVNQDLNALLTDTDATNELLGTVTLNGNNLELTDAGGTTTVDLSSLVDSVASLDLIGTDLIITSSEGDTVNQDLSSLITSSNDTVESALMVGDSLAIVSGDGDTVFADLNQFVNPLDNDTSATNEAVDSLVLAGPNVLLYEGGSLAATLDLSALAAADVDSVSSLNLIGTDLIIISGDGDTVNQDLASILPAGTNDTVDQAVMVGDSLAIVSGDGDTAYVDLNQFVNPLDNDTSATNELISGGTLNGNNLEITDAGGTTVVDLSSLVDSVASLNLSGTELIIVSSEGDTVNQDLASILPAGTNDTVDQAVMVGDSLAIVSGDGDTAYVDLNQFVNPLDNDTSATNELISGGTLNGNNLEITDAGGTTVVDLSSLVDSVASLNLSGTELIIVSSEGDTVNQDLASILPSGTNDTVDQAVMVGDSLAIVSGDGDTAFVDLNQFTGDNLGDHIMTQNLETNGNYISNDGDNEGLFVNTDGDVGVGTNTPNRRLQVHDGGTTFSYVQISHNNSGNTVNDGFQLGSSGQQAFVRNYETGPINFLTNGTDNRMVITAPGRVGIGTQTPASKLEVTGEGRFDTLTVDGLYTLPTSAPGSNGEVLTYNGSNLVWQAPGASSDTVSSVLMIGDSLAIVSGDGDTLYADLNQFVNPLDNDTSPTNEAVDSLVLTGPNVLLYEGGGLAATLDLSALAAADIDTTSAAVMVGDSLAIVSGDGDTVFADLNQFVNLGSTDTNTLAEVLAQGNTALGDTAYLGGLSVGAVAGNSALINANDNTTDISIEVNNTTTSTVQTKGVFANISGLGAGDRYAVYGEAAANGGDKYGVYGDAQGNGNTKYGVYGTASGTGTNYAGYFQGLAYADSLTIANNYTLPTAAPTTTGQVITYNGTSVVWSAPGSPVDSVYVSGGGDSLYVVTTSGTTGYELTPNDDDDWSNSGTVIVQTGRNTSIGTSNSFSTFTQNALSVGSNNSNTGNNALAVGNNMTVSGDQSTAIGFRNTSSGTRSHTYGSWLQSTATDAITIGGGVDGSNLLINNQDSTIMLGYRSTLPTMTIAPGEGIGTVGEVGIGTSTPSAMLDVAGSATIDSLNINGNYSFPTAAPGGAGEVLTYDGTNVVWQAPSAGSADNDWDTTQAGDALFNLSDSIVIGDSNRTDAYVSILAPSAGASGLSLGLVSFGFDGDSARGIVGIGEGGAERSIGVTGYASGAPKNIGVLAYGSPNAVGDTGYAIYAESNKSGGTDGVNYAGYFANGNVFIQDTLILELNGGASPGHVLTSDANGYATWQAPSGGASLWDTAGGTLFDTTNNVGIGTDSAVSSLQIGSNLHFQNFGTFGFMSHNVYFNGSDYIYTENGGATLDGSGGGAWQVTTFASGTAGAVANSNATGQMTYENGRLAINDDNPSDATLELYPNYGDSIALLIGVTFDTVGPERTGLVRFRDTNSNYIDFQAPNVVNTSYLLTLPADPPNNGDVLSSNGAGILSWQAPSGSSDTNTIEEVLIAGNNANGQSIVNLDTMDATYGNMNRLDGDTLFMNYASIGQADGQTLNFDTTRAQWAEADTAVLNQVYTDGIYTDSIFTDEIEFGTWTGSDPWRIDGNSPASNGNVLTYQNGYGVWAPSSSSLWETNGTTLFDTTYANVAIGDTQAPSRFFVYNVNSGGFNVATFSRADSGTTARGFVGEGRYGTTDSRGVQANATGSPLNYAVYAEADAAAGQTAYGIYANTNGAGTGYAGYFDDGRVYINDSLKIGGGPTSSPRRLDVVGDAYIDSIWTDSLTIGSGANSFVITENAANNGDVLTYQNNAAVWQPSSAGSGVWDTISNTVYLPNYKKLALFADSAQSDIQIGEINHIFQFNDGSDSGLIQTVNINDQLQYTLDGPASISALTQDGLTIFSAPSALAGTAFNPSAPGTTQLNINNTGVTVNGDNADGAFEVNTVLDSTAIVLYNGSASPGAPLIVLTDESGGENIGFQAADTLKTNYKIILPDTAPADGQVMRYNNSINRLEWANASSADTTCPSGFGKVTDEYCIELTAHTVGDWFDANDTCFSLNAKLPSWSEWYTGTKQVVTDWDGSNTWEWLDQASQNNASIVGGGVGANTEAERRTVSADNPDAPANTIQYRCVYRLRD